MEEEPVAQEPITKTQISLIVGIVLGAAVAIMKLFGFDIPLV